MFPIRDLNPTCSLPVVTVVIVVLNFAAFFLWQERSDSAASGAFLYEHAGIACEITSGEPLTAKEIIRGHCIAENRETPEFPHKNVWLAAIVSMFLHGGLFHIISNMWFLWLFGNNVEEAFGSLGYLLFYLATGVAATAAFVATNSTETVPLVGASGAIAGVLGSYLILFPKHRVVTWILFFFVPVPALLFLGFWLLSQFGIQDAGVAWQAHVGGFLAGALVTLPLRRPLLRRVEKLHRVRYRA